MWMANHPLLTMQATRLMHSSIALHIVPNDCLTSVLLFYATCACWLLLDASAACRSTIRLLIATQKHDTSRMYEYNLKYAYIMHACTLYGLLAQNLRSFVPNQSITPAANSINASIDVLYGDLSACLRQRLY
jgi:hypothetical protein